MYFRQDLSRVKTDLVDTLAMVDVFNQILIQVNSVFQKKTNRKLFLNVNILNQGWIQGFSQGVTKF